MVSLQVAGAEIVRFNDTLAVSQTARNGYIKASLPQIEVIDKSTKR